MSGRRGKKNKRFKRQKKEETFQQKCCGIPFDNRVAYIEHVRDRHPWALPKGL